MAGFGFMVVRIVPDKGEVEDLTKEFIAESHEGLERMDLCLTELEKRPGDRELVAEIFRTVHTIKGTTGFLDLHRLEKLAHAGEGLLGALRDGKLAVTSELISEPLRLLDASEVMAWDGQVKIVPLVEGVSTTQLIAKRTYP